MKHPTKPIRTQITLLPTRSSYFFTHYLDRTFHKFLEHSIQSTSDEEEELELLKEALISKDLELALTRLGPPIARAKSKGGKIRDYHALLYTLSKANQRKEISGILLTISKCFSLLIKKSVYLPLVHACILIVKDDYVIQNIRTIPEKNLLDMIDTKYSPTHKYNLMKDHMYDMHTRQGAMMGRGMQHFIEEGSVVKNLGYPELYKEDFIKEHTPKDH